MKLETMIDQDGQVFWTTSAVLSSLFAVLALLIWMRPVILRPSNPTTASDVSHCCTTSVSQAVDKDQS